MDIFPFIIFYSLISFSVLQFSTAADTLTSYQSIANGESLVSSGQRFELGFFSPSGSKNLLFLGIWYYKISPQTVVWVANRENPITDSYGNLTISNEGNLVLFNATKDVIWYSNSSTTVQSSSVAQLLNSGNLVLKKKSTDADTESSYIWQSFDFPSDTLLPGMKHGWNLKTGLNRYLTSWRDAADPSPGDFTYGVEITGIPQFVLRKGSSEKTFRTGPWNGVRFSGIGWGSTTVFKHSFIFNADEVYYIDESSHISRLTLNQTGILQRFILNEGSSEWALMNIVQNDPCDGYGRCGANGICRINNRPICECLEGFIPKSQEEWDQLDWSSGCVRRTSLDCHNGDGFVKLKNVKLPDLLEFWLKESLNLKECKAECLKNCSCTAYGNSDIRGGGSGCLMWFDNLVDIRDFNFKESEQDMYIRMPASELNHDQKKKTLVLIAMVSTVSGMVVLSLLTWCIIKKRRKETGIETKNEDWELPFFDLFTIANATMNFSSTNMLGEGGFGPVYKGKLATGQEIAVKRLLNNSGQGVHEFKNEVTLISKLQHRNLVRLLGCCIEGVERMLIYEFMPNKSLDYFIFDQNGRQELPWQKRFEIVLGISRGLLYLHQDSRLRIIHRDLKASNILLDDELNPKISDFGIARSFGRDQIEAKTKRVIGTHGYMSPEYAMDGKFSVKSDIFSFGVLLLEIVCGKKNWKFHHPDHHHSLLGHAWMLWNEHRAMELVDPCLEISYIESQVLKCIQVGLLCVQKLSKDRPIMSSIVLMLGNEGVTLPQPKQPGFFVERCSIDAETSTGENCHTRNELTTTIMEAR
ncbi:G-type lectin S-receptor-like serine/threonine-protein kinase At4g27290 [Cornus florida]|uniref:G-type lectin S-receptor-like serine/threonine-protein kinase At4g27290 n=1 Tax=Cornus florida TaxID=4283 RepID=UPI00289C459B|nr:G-type lectin S-receptor-like serine/threonine-protein kinase At4g27290 [Cornus florida]